MQRRAFIGGLAATAALALGPSAFALPDPARAGVARRYVDCAFGQLHLHVARPEAPAITQPTLVLLHQTALSARMFDRFLPVMAQDRIVIAVDTPGYGRSDRPAERPDLAGYGDAILDALLAEYGGSFDLLGYHTGAAIAADLTARREAIGRTVLVSMPYFSDERRAKLVAQIDRPLNVEDEYSADGSHLLSSWQGTFNARAEGQTWDNVANMVAEKQMAGRFGGWALLSAMEEDLGPRLDSIDKPVLVIAPHDGLEPQSRAAAAAIPSAQLIEWPDAAFGLFDANPQRMADTIRPFLKR